MSKCVKDVALEGIYFNRHGLAAVAVASVNRGNNETVAKAGMVNSAGLYREESRTWNAAHGDVGGEAVHRGRGVVCVQDTFELPLLRTEIDPSVSTLPHMDDTPRALSNFKQLSFDGAGLGIEAGDADPTLNVVRKEVAAREGGWVSPAIK
jgi:hypothetical protein